MHLHPDTMTRLLGGILCFLILFGLALQNIRISLFDTNNFMNQGDWSTLPIKNALIDMPRLFGGDPSKKTTIAYAVSVTSYDPEKVNARLVDRAAVLHQSIKLAMKQSSRYDYHLYAFLHPDAIAFRRQMEQFGYRVQIRDTPFNLSSVPNREFIKAQNNGCCKEKEYIKLYSWLLSDYPVVIHLDLDTLVLKPMDDLFDLMTDPLYNRSNFQNSSMWNDMDNFDRKVDFLFTRDYNMVNPPNKQPHQIGVQGGFLAVRPNESDFQKYVDTIVSGKHWFGGSGWGGSSLGFGGYYGAATIQGLASYYYGHLEQNRSMELNRCHYNTMVDDPYFFNKNLNRSLCRTTEPNLSCQDCRETAREDIYSVHFTSVCGKPEWCGIDDEDSLCMRLFYRWHEVRLSLEQEWLDRYGPDYQPNVHYFNITPESTKKQRVLAKLQGHCSNTGLKSYLPLQLPVNVTEILIP